MTVEEADEARNQLLDTRARYMLRNSVVEAVLSANPILKAVHNGTDASPVERDLLSYVEKRDEASIAVAKFASERGELRDKATKAQSKLLARAGHNAELASRLLELVARIDEKKGQQDDSAAQEALREFEGALAASRRRWRVIKGLRVVLLWAVG
uniref:Centromere protein H C-terminal domain-containing protein n=1 Tax=Bionectria ochroleuca TaxID=29856 RepID=A0A8H7N9R4_BIOOC